MKIVFKIKQLAYKIWSPLSKQYSCKTESHFVNNRTVFENFHISLTFVDSKALINIKYTYFIETENINIPRLSVRSLR